MDLNNEKYSYKISVIIPMYNAERTIIRALDSVYNQTYKTEYQVIVINDGSIDNCLQIIERYKYDNKLNNLRIINKENGGVSSARNAGLKIAEGEYIAFLDSDDKWLPDKIFKQIKIFESDESIALLGGIFEQLKFKLNNNLTRISIKQLIFKNYFQPSTVVVRKFVIDDIGFFNEDQKYAEEGNYFYRICYKYQCFLLNEKLIVYGDGKSCFGEQGLAANLIEMEKGELSNLFFAYKSKYINILIYIIAVIYSGLKFIRRLLIVKIRKYV